MREEFIETHNYITLVEAFENLERLPATSEHMGLGYGRFGLGKTFSLERIAARKNAILMRSVEAWTPPSFLEELCEEMGLDTKGTSKQKFRRICDAMLRNPRPIIIDEVDLILPRKKFGVMETIRDIHDITKTTIFFIGMESSNAKLKNEGHYYSRVVELVEFKPVCEDDIQKFCALSEVVIEPDLVKYFVKRYPNLRQVKVLIARIENWCETNGVDSVDQKTFKTSGVENGFNTAV